MKNLELSKVFMNVMQINANPNTNTTGANSQGNDLSPTMKEFYDTSLLENARADLYFTQFGTKQNLPKNHGDTVEWRKWSTFAPALTPLTEGVTPDGNKLNMTKITQNIEQYGDYTTISDRLELEAVDNVILGATEEHGAQASETLDTVTRNELLTGTHVLYGGSAQSRYALTASDKLTGALVNKAATALKKMRAKKINGKYYAIIHPSVAEDLRNDSAWLDAHKYAKPEEIFNGEIGELHGVRFVETDMAKVYKGEPLDDGTAGYLTAYAAVTADDDVKVNETLVADALVGRLVLIGTGQYKVKANTTDTLTLVDPITGDAASVTCSQNDKVYPGEGGAQDVAVYACEFFGDGAWGVIDPSAESMQMIIKPKGSGGTADPLDQRSTVGWKASTAAKILYEERLVRVEVGSSYSSIDEGN